MSDPAAERASGRSSVSIIYFSGVGGTKLVAELLGALVSRRTACEILSIEDPRASELASEPGLLVLCYPTYFLKPAPAMQEFLTKLPAVRTDRQAMLVTTYELYTGNSNRRAARLLRDRGIPVVGSFALRSPGTDLACVVPYSLCKWLYRFERGFPRKAAAIAREITDLAVEPPREGKIPSPKWYTPLSWVLQVLAFDGFIRWRDRIKLLKERCSSCGLCVRECYRGAWRQSEEGPEHFGKRCDLCTRCIHRCPQRALVLVEGLKDNRRLDPPLYDALLREAFEACDVSLKISGE